MAKFKFYYDLMSQPSRALWIALRLGKIPHEDCPVALRKSEHLKPEYKEINRFQKVPAIVDEDFHLGESVAIVRYLSDKGKFSEALYPKALQHRARVDEFLEWQHLGVRFGCTSYFLDMWLFPISGIKPKPSAEKAAMLCKNMETQLKILEEIWLKDNNFVVENEITVADLFGCCEVEQIKLTQYDVGKKFPKTAEWMQRVRAQANPHYDAAHAFIYKKSGLN
ncbi:glutathione S-transferase theta-1 [Rhagoletis pomonella]|uniref:glutathione S-transferase theta-1 n=1 Tax=Rhagoletis pomonella TaxID=28610 RepID=UPI00177FF71F|nr:glutathione S-transferase theta-1 [Rhagoletis pomonella]XP_036333640.1 glutathione S-transferase theta-1 [Rhagoletis pomonella]